jgi:hypothetical protein
MFLNATLRTVLLSPALIAIAPWYSGSSSSRSLLLHHSAAEDDLMGRQRAHQLGTQLTEIVGLDVPDLMQDSSIGK